MSNPEVAAADVPSVVPEDESVHTGKISPSKSPFLNKALDESTQILKELQQVLFYLNNKAAFVSYCQIF